MRALLYFTAITSHILCPFLSLYLMENKSMHGYRKRHRALHRKMVMRGKAVVYSFDARYLLLSYFQTYPWTSYLVATSMNWFTVNKVAQIKTSSSIWTFFGFKSDLGLLWPPDGWIIHSIMFTLTIGTWIAISTYLILMHVHRLSKVCWRNRQEYLELAKSLLKKDFMKKCFRKSSLKLQRSSNQVTSKDLNISFRTVLSSVVFNSSALNDDVVSWDCDSVKAVLDNSANCHIWQKESDFLPGTLVRFNDNNPFGVMTIGSTKCLPVAKGTVPIKWNDNQGKSHKYMLEDCLLFPTSPVNVISVSCLAATLEDEEGTWIKTRWRRSTFAWDNEKFTMDIHHPFGNIPTINVNPGIESLKNFHTFCRSHKVLPAYCRPVAFKSALPEDKHPDSLLRKDARYDYIDSEVPTSGHLYDEEIEDGVKAKLKKDGIHQSVEIKSTRIDHDTDVQYATVELDNGATQEVTNDFLFPTDDEDIASLPTTVQDIRDHTNQLDKESLEAILKPPEQTPLVKEFYAWHFRLGHIPFTSMFRMAEQGYLPRRFLKLKKEKLLCSSCIFGRCKRRPWRSKSQPGKIRRDNEKHPGDRVSVDHIISAQPGLVPRVDGRHTLDRITSGCVFVDHVSGYSYTNMQTSCDNLQTIASKREFEKHAATHNVTKVHAYHADNGIFAEKVFRDEVISCNQTISYCAVGAHHQNGIVESRIGELTRGARTNLLHAQRQWPEAISSILWPYAWMDYEKRCNHFKLDKDGLSPAMKFAGSEARVTIKDYHPFGCPVFVLDAKLQNSGGAGAPKWDPRARSGIYLGHSPLHASSVALVLNPKTLHVSPQYHVVFDDEFTTVPYMRDGVIPPNWKELVKHSRVLVTDEEFTQTIFQANDNVLEEDSSTAEEEDKASSVPIGMPLGAKAGTRHVSWSDLDTLDGIRRNKVPEEVKKTSPVSEKEIDESFVSEEATVSEEDGTSLGDDDGASLLFPTMANLNDLSCRRSSRTRKPTATAKASNDPTVRKMFGLFIALFSVFTAISYGNPNLMVDKVVAHSMKINTHFDGTINHIHHMALATTSGDNDTYHLKQMFQQPDVDEFRTAMDKEIEDHEKRNHWTLMLRSQMPEGMKTIRSVWSFKRKRYPDGRILKHKARLCAHGGMQTWGENYWETYAPVVNWMSIRTLMVLSLLHDLETRSIDFVLAFPQAELDVDVYMELPYGFEGPDQTKRYVLKLNKNLYGLKQAAHNWFEKLKAGLEERGYHNKSDADPCVFFGKNAIILVYVDDCIVFEKKGSKAAEKLLRDLGEGPENFVFTDEGDLSKYLGVDVKKHKDGRFELTQTHLIQRFLDVVGLEEGHKTKPTPAMKPLLFKDLDGIDRKHKWNYRQAIGMLTYLQGTTRPDIAMAVHQCARFSIMPKLTHERAIYRIAKYLKGTNDKGIIIKPNKNLGLECFVDADFAGGWNQADAQNAESVMSRTGYVIMLCGCPLLWCSKLQTEIALSTTESEYIALSQALREVIPLTTLLEEINNVFPIGIEQPKIHCKVWEDNESCISIAKNQKFSPRTKHIAIKWHHFRQYVKDGRITIHSIDTKEQTADIFTKPLDLSLFVYLRKKLSGW